MRLQLPEVDLFDPQYIAESKCQDRCSCAPDSLDGVYFGMVCRRHDEDYQFIAEHAGELTYFERLALKWQADRRLESGIREAYARASKSGVTKAMVAKVYRAVAARCNWLFRLWKAITLRTM